jgi:hypothetical protein
MPLDQGERKQGENEPCVGHLIVDLGLGGNAPIRVGARLQCHGFRPDVQFGPRRSARGCRWDALDIQKTERCDPTPLSRRRNKRPNSAQPDFNEKGSTCDRAAPNRVTPR